jgi:hypothetical protein
MSAMPIMCKLYFRHCRFIFMCYASAMTFAEQLADYTAAQIIAALNCPRGTAYDWKDGRREPPAWQQPHWLALLQSSRAAGEQYADTKRRKASSRKRS